MTQKPLPALFQEGIRFECQGTAQCCLSRGSYGYVYLTLKDRQRMAKVLKLSTLAFTRTHCAKTDGHFHLKAPEKDCHFLIGTRCSVYSGRPEQCRTWPFWPENLNSKTWNAEIVPFCKGVGKGRLYSTAEIEVLAKRDPIR